MVSSLDLTVEVEERRERETNIQKIKQRNPSEWDYRVLGFFDEFEFRPIMALTSVKMSEEVWLTCATHGFTTESEEIMGLLLGDIEV